MFWPLLEFQRKELRLISNTNADFAFFVLLTILGLQTDCLFGN